MDWTFLLPWADALRRVIAYDARDELAYATLHDRVDFTRLALAELDALGVVQSHDARWQQLASLSEALELVALAVHYDKSAWRFWRNRLGSTFPLDESHPDVRANWQLSFCAEVAGAGDSSMALEAGVDMLTRMPVDILGMEYHAAKLEIQAMVGDAWEDSYRVPVSLQFKVPPPEHNHDVTPWLSVVYELVRSLSDPTGITGECFCLGSVSLALENAPIMVFTDEPTINNAVTICPLGAESAGVFVDELVLHGSRGVAQFAGCTQASSEYPPFPSQHHHANAAQLALQSIIHLPDGSKDTLDALGWAEDDEFLIASDPDEDGRIAVLVPGYGSCLVGCEVVVNARELSDAPGVQGIEFLSTASALLSFVSKLGSSLTGLSIDVSEDVMLFPTQVEELFLYCPQLQFLALRRVHIRSMDSIVDLYRSKQCRLSVLSLWDSRVDNDSLTRFALALADKKTYMSKRLKEFRYIFAEEDDEPPVQIPTRPASRRF